jgi:hypothetical protein
MSHKLNALLTAVLALAAVPAAHATLKLPNATSNGNSSVAFVAIDTSGTISYTADLGVVMADFLPLIAGQTFAQGALSSGGTTAVFNLYNNSYSLNGVAQSGSYSWAGNLNSFLNNSSVTGGNYQWGIIAGDSVQGAASSTNVARNLNILFSSGTVVDYDNSNDSGINPAAVSGAGGQITQFFATSNTAAGNTHAAGTAGSNTATSGTPFLGTSMAQGIGNFSQQFGNNNFLVNPGDTSYFSWVYVNGPSTTATLGNTLGIGADPAQPATWTWNAATGDLTYTVPVPEPGTYAMLVAGLAAMSLVVRRRNRG